MIDYIFQEVRKQFCEFQKTLASKFCSDLKGWLISVEISNSMCTDFSKLYFIITSSEEKGNWFIMSQVWVRATTMERAQGRLSQVWQQFKHSNYSLQTVHHRRLGLAVRVSQLLLWRRIVCCQNWNKFSVKTMEPAERNIAEQKLGFSIHSCSSYSSSYFPENVLCDKPSDQSSRCVLRVQSIYLINIGWMREMWKVFRGQIYPVIWTEAFIEFFLTSK